MKYFQIILKVEVKREINVQTSKRVSSIFYVISSKAPQPITH